MNTNTDVNNYMSEMSYNFLKRTNLSYDVWDYTKSSFSDSLESYIFNDLFVKYFFNYFVR
jgi:hypothetical protein